MKEKTGISLSPNQFEEIVRDPKEPWAVKKVGKANKRGLPAGALNTLIKKIKKPSFRERYGI